jgi:hypothetical protein
MVVEYKLPRLRGPLGVTYSLGGIPTEAEKRVRITTSIPTKPSITTKPATTTTSSNSQTSKTAWNEWIKKQDEAHDERVAAFTADPSIFRRGSTGNADISIFGQPFEHGISIGAMFPSVFTQIKTPHQTNELQRENRRLENIVLDRVHSCQMCSATFPLGTIGEEAKREHLQEHITALKEIERVASGNFKQDMGTKLEGIYCGVCGLTDDEYEKANAGTVHGPACMDALMLRGLTGPQYCRHCRLDLWDAVLMDDDIEAHIANCTNQSLGKFSTPL